MRSRILKPGFFKNEVLGRLGFAHRVMFAGLWCLADREGRLEDRPERIKAEVFPYDAVVDVEGLLCDLAEAGFIVRYSVNGGISGGGGIGSLLQVIQVVRFAEHQRPHQREAVSLLPAIRSQHPEGVCERPSPLKTETETETETEHLGASLANPRSSLGISRANPRLRQGEAKDGPRYSLGDGEAQPRRVRRARPLPNPDVIVVRDHYLAAMSSLGIDGVWAGREARVCRELLDAGRSVGDITQAVDSFVRLTGFWADRGWPFWGLVTAWGEVQAKRVGAVAGGEGGYESPYSAEERAERTRLNEEAKAKFSEAESKVVVKMEKGDV